MMSNQLWYLSLLISLLNALLHHFIHNVWHFYDIVVIRLVASFSPFLTHSLDHIHRRRRQFLTFVYERARTYLFVEETACYSNNGSELRRLIEAPDLDVWCLIYFPPHSHTKLLPICCEQKELSMTDGRRNWDCKVRGESNHNLISEHLSWSEYRT